MGIMIGDRIQLPNGLGAENTYGSFGPSEIHIEKVENDENDNDNDNGLKQYRIYGRAMIWSSEQYRIEGRPPIDMVSIQVVLPESSLNNNIYYLLYSEWKSKYTNTTDLI